MSTIDELSKIMIEFQKRLESLEERSAAGKCSRCDRTVFAKGLCSPHYQQKNYWESKSNNRDENV